ncbi:MAG: hypothetical protein AAF603_07090 [Pseudomonadota bacterium]
MQTSLTFALDNRLPEIHDRLAVLFPLKTTGKSDPLKQLVFVVVSEGAGPAVGLAVYNRLWTLYPNFGALRDAAVADLQDLFIGLPHAERKAQALPEILKIIENHHGSLDLDFLSKMPAEAARRWLSLLPGVNSAMATAVLTFSGLKKPMVALNQEAARAVRRLGLCEEGAPLSALPRQVAERAPAQWRGTHFAQFSEGMQQVARRHCVDGAPKCGGCPLKDLCPSGERAAAKVIPFSRYQSAQKKMRSAS